MSNRKKHSVLRHMVVIPRRSRCLVIILLLVFFQLCSIFIFSMSSAASKDNALLSQLDNLDFKNARTFVNDWFHKHQANFDEKLSRMMNSIDLSNKKFWKFQNDLVDTQLEVPLQQLQKEQRLLSFDPRFTYSIYLNHVKGEFEKRNPKNEPTIDDDSKKVYVPFQWSDWVDLSLLNQYIALDELVKPTCELIYPKTVPKGSRGKRDLVEKENKDTPSEETSKKSKKKTISDFCIPNSEITEEYLKENNLKDTSTLPGFNVIDSGTKLSLDKKRLQAKSFLYSTFDNPSSILFLSDDGIYEVFTDKRQKLRSTELFSNYIAKYSNGEKVVFDPLREFQSLTSSVPAQNFVGNETIDHLVLEDENMRLHLNESSFEYDYEKIIQNYETLPKLTSKQKSHYESLKYSSSIETMELSKYFKEVALASTTTKRETGAHYDWRFFNGFLSLSALNDLDDVSEKKRIILHRLLRNWLQFTYKTNIITWIAHGSLLSWYWDGISFPWDVDIDVQMPMMELDRFSLMFNNSLVVENINEGFGKFYVDCSSYLTHRTKGNGRNNIDARFIDVDSGFYIDITGLAMTETQLRARYRTQLDTKKVEQIMYEMKGGDNFAKLSRKEKEEAEKRVSKRFLENKSVQAYNCRNNHFYLLKELSPLRVSLIEGTKTLIPNNFKDILKLEYTRGMTVTTFNRHVYLPQIRLWLPFETIYGALKEEVESIYAKSARKPSRSRRVTAAKIIRLMKEIDEDMIFKLLQDQDILKEYYLTNEITKLHQLEMDHIMDDTMTREFISDNVINHKFKPLRKDMFSYKQQVANSGEMKKILIDDDEIQAEILQRFEAERDVEREEEEKKSGRNRPRLVSG